MILHFRLSVESRRCWQNARPAVAQERIPRRYVCIVFRVVKSFVWCGFKNPEFTVVIRFSHKCLLFCCSADTVLAILCKIFVIRRAPPAKMCLSGSYILLWSGSRLWSRPYFLSRFTLPRAAIRMKFFFIGILLLCLFGELQEVVAEQQSSGDDGTEAAAAIAVGMVNEDVKGHYVGCFSERIDLYDPLPIEVNVNSCLEICERAYFRYAVLSANKCACSTEFDAKSKLELGMCDRRCKRNKSQFCGGNNSESYYATGVKVSGPPTSPYLTNLTDTSIVLHWKETPQPSYVTHYMIKAVSTKTFATYPLPRLSEWTVDKSEKHFQLTNLHPGTEYNISVSAMCGEQNCGTASTPAETLIGKPSPLPRTPTILEHAETTIKVDVPNAINNNGPISFYRLIVMFVDDSLQQAFNEMLLASYNQSVESGVPYYITAEFEYQTPFVIGDGKTYHDYYNAPLPPDSHVHVSVGIVSIHNSLKTVAYAIATHDQHNRITDAASADASDVDQTSIVALSVACVIFGLLLIASFVIYGYLRFKTGNRPQRLSDNHELTLQGPMVEVENNGFVPDNQSKENFRDQLTSIMENLDGSQKFARSAIRLNIDNILAQGTFGDVISGKLFTNSESWDCQVHVISDDMEPQDQIVFLKDFKQLIRVMPHDKFIRFFGVSASPDWFYLIFELPGMLLKKCLVEARIPPSIDSARFSAISEEQILQWIYDISVAMEYLEVNRAIYKTLCSYSIYVTPSNQLKLSLFGPIRLGDQEKEIDIARWLAPEVLRFQHHSIKADVWSFACIGWECCTLGGTLYANITSQDLLPRIKNGLRPEQPAFIFNDLYQLFLNCWQMEPSERPDFEEIAFNVRQVLTSPRHSLSYDRFDRIFIPYYLPLLEMKN